MSASYDQQERSYYDRLFVVIDKEDAGVLPGQDALPFLVSSGLSQQLLGEVWALADPDNNGFLTRDGWYKAARLIGWMQKGNQATVDESLLTKRGPYPTFAGQQPPPLAANTTGNSLPPVTPADRTKFTRIFVGCGPQNGLVSGEKAQNVFVKSQLSYDKLGQIWNLADTQQRGSLDLTDFIIGMYLIQSCMANPSLSLPTTLPSGTYEQASGGRPSVATPMSPQRTGSSLRPQTTGPTSPINPQRTGGSPRPSGSFPVSASSPQRWDVTPESKATSDQFFTQLDTQNKGVIEGDVAVPFMLQSQLDEGALATIWDLADIKHEGRLDRDQFAVAMYLINAKLAGKNVPTVLPQSLIPPSLRGTAGQQEVLNGPSSATKDLFDLFDDTPSNPVVASAPQQPAVAFLPQPPSRRATRSPPRPATTSAPNPGDLLWDEPAPSNVNSNSAEVGNKQNELANTTRSLESATKTKQDLEKTDSDQQAELSDLESKLSSAKSKHELELKAVADLRLRVGEQSSRLKQVQSEVISAESDVSAMRSEKDELGQALLRDKEEVRSLQRMMKEIEEEKATLKSLLEKMRKEARQQKGLVTIARKQLSTAETSRDVVQKDIDGEAASAASAAAVPLPSTPQTLSPMATGVSQRSNNPFDRFTRGEAAPASGGSLLDAGAAGAAGAAIVSGAETLFHAAKEAIMPGEAQSTDTPDAAPTQSFEEQSRALDGRETDQQGETFKSSTGTAASEVGEPGLLGEDYDPFGAPSAQTELAPAQEADFGFADISRRAPSSVPATGAAVPTDFDSAFADLDDHVETAPETITESSPNINIDESRSAAGLERDLEHNDSAVEPQSPVETPYADKALTPDSSALVGAVDVPTHEDPMSSDEEEGPEDVESSSRYQAGPPTLSSPVESPPIRRSAPPPPTKAAVADFDPFVASTKTSSVADETPIFTPAADIVDIDPFGAPAQSSANEDQPPSFAPAAPVNVDPFGAPAFGGEVSDTTRQVTPPAVAEAKKGSTFDDDDFDFSDLPPAKVEQTVPTAGAGGRNLANFDDEFAGFDDEFAVSQPPSGSDNSTSMSKSYEMVSAEPRMEDEWGVAPQQTRQPSSLSFDDAFGGDFEPQTTSKNGPNTYAASPSTQSRTLAPPPLPQRQDSQPQGDDIEDVKKLCAMGFPRSLVIPALDANGYDFQKALNVLLTG